MKLFDDTFKVIEKSMDLRIKRHAVLSSNIANSETPNYRAREIDFAGELQKVLNKSEELVKTSSQHMDILGSEGSHVTFDDSGAVGADGNNVDLDIETGKLSTNARAYSEAATLLSLKLRMLQNATRDRGGF